MSAPLMKMMILAPRRAGMSHADFRRYVVDVHGPLVRSIPEVAADIRHYHYNFPVAGAADSALLHPLADHLDIVTQGWFDSVAAQRANMRHAHYLQVVRPDEGRFADETNALMHYTSEHLASEHVASEHVAGEHVASGRGAGDRGPPPYKVFWFRRRRSTLSRATFQRAWRERYAPALAAAARAGGLPGRCVLNEVLAEQEHPDGANPRYYDVIDELGLPSPGALANLRSDESRLAALRALEAELLEPGRTRALLTETVVNIP
jgi:hypothetical protein